MDWISILKCPHTGDSVEYMSPDAIGSLNQRIKAKQIWNCEGELFCKHINKALISENRQYISPLIDDVVLMLPELALVEDKQLIKEIELDSDKALVRNFYSEKGWETTEEGKYLDGAIFEDFRPEVQDYIKKCHDRVKRHLPDSGAFIMDAASGAMQYED